jgi:ribose transport system substrate-binding protein
MKASLYRLTIALMIIILSVTIAISIILSANVDRVIFKANTTSTNRNKIPKYHFSVIIKNTDDPYLKNLGKGLTEQADSSNVVLEMNYSSDSDENDTIKYINMAIDSKVDGIITHAFNTDNFQKAIDKAETNNIPVILLDNDVPKSKRSCFVGLNTFQIGTLEGKLVNDGLKSKSRVAFIMEQYQDFNNLQLEGFNNVIKLYSDIKIETTKNSEPGILGANNVTQDIINNYPDINAIVCSSAKDTIGAAKVLVDLNKVGDISIIGFDSTPEILSYIDKGIIYGTIIPDGYSIGSKSISALMSLKEKGTVSSIINTETTTVTKADLKQYTASLQNGGK